MDSLISEFFKWILSFMVFILGLVTFLFFFEVAETTTFKQHVAYEIERNGGLTTEAVQSINAYSNDHFKGRYVVESNQMYQEVDFGEVVDFTVIGTYTPKYFDFIGEYEIPSNGFAVSMTRDN